MITEDPEFMQRLELELERNYGREHPLWDMWMSQHRNAISRNTSLFVAFISKYLLQSHSMRCLDLGCGMGAASIVLAQNNNTVIGLDVFGLELSRLRAEKHKASVNFVQGDGRYLPFKDQLFDFIMCDQVVEHEGTNVLVVEEKLATSLEGVTLDTQDTPEGPKLVVSQEPQNQP